MKSKFIILLLCAFPFIVGCTQDNAINDDDDMPKIGNNVSFTPCQQSKLKSSSESSDKIDVRCTDKGIQITHYDFEVTCDFTTVNVTYTFVNGVLNITQQGTPNQADCICYTDVSYTIDEISLDKVNVIFINGVLVYCYNENDILVCGVKKPLQNIEWLKEYCESLNKTSGFSIVHIDLYKVVDTNEYLFKIGISYSEFDDSPFGYSGEWRNCIGEIIFAIKTGVPPMPEVVENFMKDKEFVAELFHLVK